MNLKAIAFQMSLNVQKIWGDGRLKENNLYFIQNYFSIVTSFNKLVFSLKIIKQRNN